MQGYSELLQKWVSQACISFQIGSKYTANLYPHWGGGGGGGMTCLPHTAESLILTDLVWYALVNGPGLFKGGDGDQIQEMRWEKPHS